MRHVSLTCKNHPELRWSCKSIAWNDVGGYNHERNIFFFGTVNGGASVKECTCPASDLVRTPADIKKFPAC